MTWEICALRSVRASASWAGVTVTWRWSATSRTIWWPTSVSRYVATKALVAVGWSPDPSWPLPAPLTGGSSCSPLDER